MYPEGMIIATPYRGVGVFWRVPLDKGKIKEKLLNELDKVLALCASCLYNTTQYDEYFYPGIKHLFYTSIINYYTIKASINYLENSDKVVIAFKTTASISDILCIKKRENVKDVLISFLEDPASFVIKQTHFPLNIKDNLRDVIALIVASEGAEADRTDNVKELIATYRNYGLPFIFTADPLLSRKEGICNAFHFPEDTYTIPFRNLSFHK